MNIQEKDWVEQLELWKKTFQKRIDWITSELEEYERGYKK